MKQLWKIGLVVTIAVSAIVAGEINTRAEKEALEKFRSLQRQEEEIGELHMAAVRGMKELQYSDPPNKMTVEQAEKLLFADHRFDDESLTLQWEMVKALSAVDGDVSVELVKSLDVVVNTYDAVSSGVENAIWTSESRKTPAITKGFARAALQVMAKNRLGDAEVEAITSKTQPQRIGERFTEYTRFRQLSESNRANIGRAIVYELAVGSGVDEAVLRKQLGIR